MGAKEKPKTEKKRRPLLRRILLMLLAAAVLSALFFVFRSRFAGGGTPFGVRPAQTGIRAESFTYENGTDQVFASVGNGLAVASGSTLQLLNSAGETVWKQVVSFGTPAIAAADDRALFCDIGGQHAELVREDGTSTVLDVPEEIITASMNPDGWYVIVTDSAGYKGVVHVYNDECEPRYEWWSGSGYVLRAAVSPDDRLLAVLCADGTGSKLHIFSLSSENELASAAFPQELAFDLGFLGSDTVCCVSEQALHFIRTDGTVAGEYSLGENALMDYDLGSDSFVALFVSVYRAGTGRTVLTLGRDGTELGRADIGESVTSLCARGRQLLVMTGGGLTLYGQDMSEQQRREMLITAKRALLRSGGGVLLLSAYAAEPFRF